MESKQTITAYSITFCVICTLAHKDPENVEAKHRFINGLHSSEVRRVLKTLILEDVMLDDLTRRGESITISKQCDDWDKSKYKQINIQKVGTTENDSTDEEEEADVQWTTKTAKTKQNQKQTQAGAAESKNNKSINIQGYLKQLGMSTHLMWTVFFNREP